MRELDRKDSHLNICLENSSDVEFYSRDGNGFSAYRFEHDALPEISFADVKLETTLFGKKLKAPLVIGAMTGGTERSAQVNARLAQAAARCGVGLALGSQRKMLGADADGFVAKSYEVKAQVPELPLLFGNLGAVQLNYGVTAANVRELVRRTGCDAFNFHLNPLQEAIQPEGDRNFSQLLPKLRSVIAEMEVPVLAKEVGAGISRRTARKLRDLGLAGVETAGLGGTSWSKIESLRASGKVEESVGALFARWGVPTAESLVHCRRELPDLTLIASGGVRNGIEIAKALALGASAAAMALPFLKAAEVSVEEVVRVIERVKTELRTAMFVVGVDTVEKLREQGPELLVPARDYAGEGA